MYQNGKNITFTDHSNSSVNMFLNDIRKSEPLSSEEEYELWCLMRQGSQRARKKLIYANLRYVVTIAKKYLVSGTAFEDLLMAGSLGITRAADLFDASLGFRFITFAKWYIESEIRKAAYAHLKHQSGTIYLDDPIHPDQEASTTLTDCLPSSADVSPDWHLRYSDSLNALKSGLNSHYWQGTGDMLADYLSIKEQGLLDSDFTRKYHLSDRQMTRFLDTVRTEMSH